MIGSRGGREGERERHQRAGSLLSAAPTLTDSPPGSLTLSLPPSLPRPARRLDARVTFLSVVAFVLVVSLTPPRRWGRLEAEAVLAVAGLIWARVPVRWALGRLALLAPFVGLALLSAPFMRTTAGVTPAVFLGTALARALMSFCALAALARSVEPPELLAALGRLRVPPLLVSLTALTLRYLSVLEEEAGRMMRARDARGTPATLGRRARVAGHMVGSLFVRSYERAERLSNAMLARGFDGTLVRCAPLPLPARDLGVAVAVAVVLGTIVLLT
jgi:cobalt/nickel transport system permease protein